MTEKVFLTRSEPAYMLSLICGLRHVIREAPGFGRCGTSKEIVALSRQVGSDVVGGLRSPSEVRWITFSEEI